MKCKMIVVWNIGSVQIVSIAIRRLLTFTDTLNENILIFHFSATFAPRSLDVQKHWPFIRKEFILWCNLYWINVFRARWSNQINGNSYTRQLGFQNLAMLWMRIQQQKDIQHAQTHSKKAYPLNFYLFHVSDRF
jgi:hypothetical protein